MFPKPTAKNTRTETSAQNIHFDSRGLKSGGQKVAGSIPGRGLKCTLIIILAMSVSGKDNKETQEASDHEPTRSGISCGAERTLYSKKVSDTDQIIKTRV